MKLNLKDPKTRLRALLGVAVACGFAVLATGSLNSVDDADVVAPVMRDRVSAAKPGNKPGAGASTQELVATLTPPNRDEVNTDASGNPFRSNSWAPAPPPSRVVVPVVAAPVVAAPPPAPTAPPLPYNFVGKLEAKNAKPRAFLSKGDALVIVSPGDVLDNNTYRVESLDQTGVVLTYLPLNQRQVIPITGGK
jgi:hypothetical protein